MNTETNAKPRASKNSSPAAAPKKKAVTRPEKAAAARAKKAASMSPAEALAAKVKTAKPRAAKAVARPEAEVEAPAVITEVKAPKSPKAAALKAVKERKGISKVITDEDLGFSSDLEAETVPTEVVEMALADEIVVTHEENVGPRFTDLPLSPRLQEVLQKNKFITPTPIQEKSIPVVMEGKDLIGIAQTGTGKTLAFGLPILEKLFARTMRGRALIILPTRELALQVEESLGGLAQQMPRANHIRGAVLIGGAPIRAQQNQLRYDPDIIIATPGRLIDHLQNGSVDLRSVEILVLDEADRMLDMGFAPQIRQIVDATPEERQTLMFSATMPDEITRMTREFLRDPERIEIERPGTKANLVSQELFVVDQEEKIDLLSKILYEEEGQVLIFARTRSRASRIAREVNNWDIRAAEIHADRSLGQRRAALDGFKNGRYRVLVATDIAARGIDVTDITLVVNFDLPDCADDYVHRIGRTGRAGRTGHAISFAAPDQWRDVRDIEKVMEMPIEISENSTGEFIKPRSNPRPHSAGFRARRGGGNRGGGGGGRFRR
jgi:ATP-dependent RNA helicase RhlE